MTKLLIDDTPLIIPPKLATYVGLNEAIFLQKLHYILKENKSVGKWADGKKWFRDKPRDWAIKCFPFWDENVVKRTIANLRKDGLVLARSDLNEIKKDRSLWYTVNYPAVNRLKEPVKRIIEKKEKRREARAAREPEKEMDSRTNDYTKVQNVLLTKEEGETTKVQNVLNGEESTKCTNDQSTKCTFTKVQNVLTPKESIPKESIPKESNNIQNSKSLAPHQAMFQALSTICHISIKGITKEKRGQLNQTERILRVDMGLVPEQVYKFGTWWWAHCWKGQDTKNHRKRPPSPKEVRDHWGEFEAWQNEQSQPSPVAQAMAIIPPRDDAPLDPLTIQWQEAQANIALTIAKGAYEQWVKPARLQQSNGHYVILAQNEAGREWMENRLKKPIRQGMESVFGQGLELEFAVSGSGT